MCQVNSHLHASDLSISLSGKNTQMHSFSPFISPLCLRCLFKLSAPMKMNIPITLLSLVSHCFISLNHLSHLIAFNTLAPRDSIPCDEEGIVHDNASHAEGIQSISLNE